MHACEKESGGKWWQDHEGRQQRNRIGKQGASTLFRFNHSKLLYIPPPWLFIFLDSGSERVLGILGVRLDINHLLFISRTCYRALIIL